MNILAFSGSNSSTSINQQLVEHAVKGLPGAEVISLRDYDAPIYSNDIELETGIPEAIQRLDTRIAKADGLLISVSEHNGNLSAFFKNTIDWLSRHNRSFLADKKIILLSASPGPGGAKSALELAKKTLPYFGADVIETWSIGGFYDAFQNGAIIDETTQKSLDERLAIWRTDTV